MKALLLSHEHALAPGGGGQQVCSREYIGALAAAGFELTRIFYATDRAWATRLRRKLRPRPYRDLIPTQFLSCVREAVATIRPGFVFCNLCDLIPLGPRLRSLVPAETKLVLLSHGLASIDDAHTERIGRENVFSASLRQRRKSWSAESRRVEMECLSAFHHVFTLAPFEVEITRSLGAPSVSWLPRILDEGNLLAWSPVANRVGIVGTFDHPPNLDGLERLCQALKDAGPGELRVRIISESGAVVSRLAASFPFLDYLGPMREEAAVRAEAATWCAFVNPLFCFAKGCSTKLASGLCWGLPVLTTTAGARGYEWRDGRLPLSETPRALAASILRAADVDDATALRGEVLKILRSAPRLSEVAEKIRLALAPLSS